MPEHNKLLEAVASRNEVDYRAYEILRDLAEDGLFTSRILVRLYRDNGETKEDAELFAQERAEEIAEILRDRRNADHDVFNVLAGR